MQISTTFKAFLLRMMNQIIDFYNSNLMGCKNILLENNVLTNTH